MTPLVLTLALLQQEKPDVVSTRSMDRINWMEFRDAVPSKVRTVLLPTGTLEPHGVIPNGADNLAPAALAEALARRLNALVAPTLPYGVTGSLGAYPGAFSVSEEAYRPFVREVLEGLARNGFRNLVVLNGHGGPQTDILNGVAADVGAGMGVRTLVVNWWSTCSDVTKEVFGEDGGHAGWNETAILQAIAPDTVHPERYSPDLALPYPPARTWSAYPFPATIGLYRPGEGLPRFDPEKARTYFERVRDHVGALVEDVIRRWDAAGV